MNIRENGPESEYVDELTYPQLPLGVIDCALVVPAIVTVIRGEIGRFLQLRGVGDKIKWWSLVRALEGGWKGCRAPSYWGCID
jgi:hypothetical protein